MRKTRYATSAWYADEFWQNLHDHCVAHVNIDSPGAVGATALAKIGAMAETYSAIRALYQRLCGADIDYQRIGRGGDQSFWGVGIPSVCGKVYEQPRIDSQRKDLSGSFGWWWHTPDDTMDKIDAENLARDARILLASTYTVAASPVLPFDQTAAIDEIRQALAEITEAAGNAFDLSAVCREADMLRAAAERLNGRVRESVSEEGAQALNACQMAVSHWLVPVNYTVTGPYSQDPALGSAAVPGLRHAARLRELPADSPARYLLLTQLRRERNRLHHAVIEARRAIEATLAGCVPSSV